MMTGSLAAHRMLVRELKKLRERAGVPVKTACQAIQVAPQTFWRMEAGQSRPTAKELYVGILCELYGATDAVTGHLTTLATEARKPDQWCSFRDIIPEHLTLLITLEETAQRVTTFQPDLIPDLLRTAEYQHAITPVEFPDHTPDDLEQMLDLLELRQARLHTDTELEFQALLCETALRNPVGGPEVMADQLHHLATLGDRPNVSIRIVPEYAGCHAGMTTGSFTSMEFPTHPTSHLTEPPLVYVPCATGAHYLDDDSAVTRYRAAISGIRRVALDETASRQLLLEIMHERRNSDRPAAVGGAA